MDARYLTVDNLREFAARWPDAEAFLNRCSLRNERLMLRHYRDTLNEWQKTRLKELDELHERQSKRQGEV